MSATLYETLENSNPTFPYRSAITGLYYLDSRGETGVVLSQENPYTYAVKASGSNYLTMRGHKELMTCWFFESESEAKEAAVVHHKMVAEGEALAKEAALEATVDGDFFGRPRKMKKVMSEDLPTFEDMMATL
jgi:hypothetical protein